MLYHFSPHPSCECFLAISSQSFLLFLLNSIGELIYFQSFNYTFKMDNGQSLLLILPFDLTISY